MGMVDRGQRFRHDYVRALEEERKKIEVFQRELPLCLQLITQAIESVEEQMCEEERSVSGNKPVLAEFIPLKPSLASTVEEDVERGKPAAIGFDAKPDWLRSVHLWNQCADTGTKVEPPKKPIAVSVKRMGGAFQPFEREKHAAPPPVVSATAAASSNISGSGSGGRGDGNGICGGDKEKEGQSQTNRKVRRCWSPELHRCFLDALQQLGGVHVATPKQIRELMNVDGLTNDEVKSHLQKMAIAGGITPRSGSLLFKPYTLSIPIYQLWKTNSFNIGQAMIKSVLGSKLICASLRSNDHPRLSYGGEFDNEPFWKTMVKDIAWSLKSVAVFLAEQPSQIKYIEWPTFQSTLRTAMLTLVLVAVLIVALSSVDSCLSYILALLLRRAA